MMANPLKRCVIKPTSACTADCATCRHRRSLHKSMQGADNLPFERWIDLIEESSGSGASGLVISGGEPTLYPRLLELVDAARACSMHVKLNTNGSRVGPEIARSLVETGLGEVQISLYSANEFRHDLMRRCRGLWKLATHAVRCFGQMKARFPRFGNHVQTLLSRENLHELPDLIELCLSLGADSLAITYLEGDFSGEHLPSVRDIETFRALTLPAATEVCRQLVEPMRSRAISVINSLFSSNILVPTDWAMGRYQPEIPPDGPACIRPHSMALVMPNGDVHPCNIVEYTHGPVMGNCRQRSLKSIRDDGKWTQFLSRRFEPCRYCPTVYPLRIPLRQSII